MHMQTITRNLWPAALALVIGLAGALASEAVLAHGKERSAGAKSAGARPHHHHRHHHHHRNSRAFVGAGVALWAWPAYPRHIVAAAPVHYIERGDTAGEHWFYCPAAGAYYPYVAECAGGWQRVPAEPTQ
jgi:hypothetical protein